MDGVGLVYRGVGEARCEFFGVTIDEARAIVRAAFVAAFGDLGARVFDAKPQGPASESAIEIIQPGAVRVVTASGCMGAGKSEFAEALAAALRAAGRRVQILPLALALKEMAVFYFELSERQVHGSIADKAAIDERWGLSPRTILQRLGTEGMRAVAGQDIWRRAWQARIEPDVDVVIVPDARFPDELDWLMDAWSARSYYIERTEATVAMLEACNGQPHASEVMMNGYQRYTERIDNNGPLAALHAAAARIAGEIAFE